MPATGFDPTIAALADLVAQARAADDRRGYFAAMYGAVTRTVRARAEAGGFADADRMAAFVARFAARYLDAARLAAAPAGGPAPTSSWAAAFEADRSWRPVVLQHLLLGMTAHIGLDLGVVAAEIAVETADAEMPGAGDVAAALTRLRPDFLAINDVLAALVPAVEAAVGRVSPSIGLLDRLSAQMDTFVVGRAIAAARDQAWHTATVVAAASAADRDAVIARIDGEVTAIAHDIAHPGLRATMLLALVRIVERRPVAEVIDVLGGIAPS